MTYRMIVAGAGGVGTRLIRDLAMMLEYKAPGSMLLVVDGDAFEPKNKQRQIFSEMGNKADVVVAEVAPNYPSTFLVPLPKWIVSSIEAKEGDPEDEVENKILASALLQEGDVVYAVVDNFACRKLLCDTARKLNNVDIFLGGNDEELYCSVYHYRRRDGVDITDHPEVTHPEFIDPPDRNPGELSCAERAELEGGALRIDQRVATPKGWQEIGSIKVGDYTFGLDGQPNLVTGTYPQGILKLFRVRFSDGAEVLCDATHRWTVNRPPDDRKNRQPRTLTVQQILDEGLRYDNGSLRHRIPITAQLNLPEADLPLHPYLLGYMLGNGSFDVTPVIATAANEATPWMELLPDGADVKRYDHEHHAGSAARYGLNYNLSNTGKQNPIASALQNLGLLKVTGSDKFIPEIYLWASIEQRWAMLQGLCDSDGTPCHSGAAEFASTSPQLAKGITQLAQSLGCLANIALIPSRARRPTEQDYYRVYISITGDQPPFRLERKAQLWQPRKFPYVRGIEAIEEAGEGEAVCIKVEREDGLFLTEGMVVTHNTQAVATNAAVAALLCGRTQHTIFEAHAPGDAAEIFLDLGVGLASSFNRDADAVSVGSSE